jgi:hypothetical protein
MRKDAFALTTKELLGEGKLSCTLESVGIGGRRHQDSFRCSVRHRTRQDTSHLRLHSDVRVRMRSGHE